jgi:hypothetical protein
VNEQKAGEQQVESNGCPVKKAVIRPANGTARARPMARLILYDYPLPPAAGATQLIELEKQHAADIKRCA